MDVTTREKDPGHFIETPLASGKHGAQSDQQPSTETCWPHALRSVEKGEEERRREEQE